jgi:hypothetical protein
MAKRVFFSFHYQDVADFRANVVRTHWLTKPDRDSAGFFDASVWESAKRTGPIAVKRLINTAIDGTTVTCVLIGSETYARPWVRYEILKSFKKGNRLIAVQINSIKDKYQRTKPKGPNPLEYVGVTFSDLGDRMTLHAQRYGKWVEYSEIDSTASFRVTGINPQLRGKDTNLLISLMSMTGLRITDI